MNDFYKGYFTATAVNFTSIVIMAVIIRVFQLWGK